MKQGLGRGLEALLKPSQQAKEEPTKSFDGKSEFLSRLLISQIEPNPFQPRLTFSAEALNELKQSIITNGLIQPITVRKINENRYQLVSGERRLRACKEIGFPDIPAYIIEVLSDDTMLAMALIENIQRERLNPIEIGLAFKRLMDECNLSQEQIAERVGKDRTTVANSIRLLKLPEEVKDSLIKDEISMGHARALINLPSHSIQIEILKKIIDGNLSVRKVESLVKSYLTESTSKKLSFGKRTNNTSQQSASISAIEEKLRKMLGTKVQCKVKADSTGELIIEFYSNDELERLLEIFDAIEKSIN